METIRKLYKVDRKQIHYIRWIIESYDGMALVTTIDPHAAVIELKIAPGCYSIVQDLLNSMSVKEKIRILPISVIK